MGVSVAGRRHLGAALTVPGRCVGRHRARGRGDVRECGVHEEFFLIERRDRHARTPRRGADRFRPAVASKKKELNRSHG
ncbi:hypothetical protein CZ774_16040 [Frigoribacterium sp. JB110]|nr:hypothetical protein CZ774_16040 [Frigoribacterium sp. JB110]